MNDICVNRPVLVVVLSRNNSLVIHACLLFGSLNSQIVFELANL